ncbi:replication initiator [Nonomuraea sp. NPDC049028]|uniref:replication initiator n=1 Tax=Nonomuraea sp. NPDC049028 TaxID=3364348 RepID=UPI0037249AA7
MSDAESRRRGHLARAGRNNTPTSRTAVSCPARDSLRHHLAKLGGLALKDLRHHVTASFAKVAEYQRRGAVHFHAVIRLDGPGGPTAPPSAWVTADTLTDAVQHAAHVVGRGSADLPGVGAKKGGPDVPDVRPGACPRAAPGRNSRAALRGRRSRPGRDDDRLAAPARRGQAAAPPDQDGRL